MVLIPYDQYISGSQKENKENVQSNRLDKELILQPFGKSQRKHAEALLSYVEKLMDWNDKGEITIKEVVISGSHITDLLKDALFSYKNFEPIGYILFYRELTNVPNTLIRNSNRRPLIGRGKPPPPGIPMSTKLTDIKSLGGENWTSSWRAL